MSDKKLLFTKKKIVWNKWKHLKGVNPVTAAFHVGNCIGDYPLGTKSIINNPECVCPVLSEEFDGAEVTQPLLAGLSASECKDAFQFDQLANDFCKVDANNFKSALGPPGDTCSNRDNNNTLRLRYCKLEDKIKGDGECTKTKLGEDKYHEAAKAYCDANPTAQWCKCYNVLNKVCETNMNAYGCEKAYGELDEKKGDLGLCDENYKFDCVDEDDTTQGVIGYKILKDVRHCRPGVCNDGYIPKDSTKGCEKSYFICDNNLDVRTMTDSEIVIKCNYGRDKTPDWMDEPGRGGSTAAERLRRRSPPFNKPPWNKLPITRWPRKFRWRDPNVRYITQYSVSSLSSCIMCISLIMLSRRG